MPSINDSRILYCTEFAQTSGHLNPFLILKFWVPNNVFITKTHLSKYIENLTTKKWKFSDKKFWFFHICAQIIDCGYSLELPQRGSSNRYPQSMFFSKKWKIIYTPVNPSSTIWKWGLRRSKLYRHVFVMLIVYFHYNPLSVIQWNSQYWSPFNNSRLAITVISDTLNYHS